MKKHYFILFLWVLAMGCATYETKYAEPFSVYNVLDEKEVEHTFYLIGDAGKSPIGDLNPTLKAFKKVLDQANANSTALFLGDNIYPAGLPDKKDSCEITSK